jgi:hypothetical protein
MVTTETIYPTQPGAPVQVIQFLREDSDRLVRVEQMVKDMSKTLDSLSAELAKQKADHEKTKSRINWLWGVGSAFAFVVTMVITYFRH